MPKDIKIKPLSRNVDKDQVVDEIIISFTRDREIDYMLPGVALTAKYIRYLVWSL
jgi:carboxymethylenebutenolidase